MKLLHEIAIFQTVKSKVIISLFETVRLSVSISLRNLYNSLNSIKEIGMYLQCGVAGCEWAFTTNYRLRRHEESHKGQKDHVVSSRMTDMGHRYR